MNKGCLFVVLTLCLCTQMARANDLTIVNPMWYEDRGELYAVFTLSWNNAWRNSKNHDAAWVFFKFIRTTGSGFVHAYLNPDGHSIVSSTLPKTTSLAIKVPADQVGALIQLDKEYRGDVEAVVKLKFNKEKLANTNLNNFLLRVTGIEMVYIPGGKVTLGDPDTYANQYGSFFKSDGNGEPDGLITIESESQVIEIGREKGKLFYKAPEKYEGDQAGTIGPDFPKGINAFYIMKYEVTQGLYTDFLNTLSDYQSQHRANFGGKGYYQNRGTIRMENNRYVADSPSRTANYLSWDDSMCLADWAGLRPMTEFEFTKACRGSNKPLASEYPWGTSSKHLVKRMITREGDLVLMDGYDEKYLNDTNRENYGASFFWVMDLAGSMWERVITIGDEKGRQFKGTHGDGVPTNYGLASNDDWPQGNNETGGFGFRGGGFYFHDRLYHDFNPFSPIAYRRYGGWSGGNRTEAYGTRFVRTAD